MRLPAGTALHVTFRFSPDDPTAILDQVLTAVADFDTHAARYDLAKATVKATKALHATATAALERTATRIKPRRRT